MSEQVNKVHGRKQVDTLHLIYLGIIAVGGFVWLGAYIFKDSISAGPHLNFAATLTSILLAVIAIVITLIDVAGQRSNIFDVKSSVEELKIVSSEIEKMVSIFNEQNKKSNVELRELFDGMTTKNDAVLNQVSNIAKKLEGLPSSEGNEEVVIELKAELENLKKKLSSDYEMKSEQLNRNSISSLRDYYAKEYKKMEKEEEVEKIKERLLEHWKY